MRLTQVLHCRHLPSTKKTCRGTRQVSKMIAVSQVLREYPIPLSLQASSPQHIYWVIRLRRRPDSNRCIKVLQTSPLPLGYVAEVLRISLPPKQKSPATWWDWGRRGHFIEEVKIQRRLVRLPRAPCPEGQSGKRDSNPRHQPWQGCALPTELFPHWS